MSPSRILSAVLHSPIPPPPRSGLTPGKAPRPLLLFCANSRSKLSFAVGTHFILHPEKVDTGGEDAFLVSSHNGGVLAIAKGVDGWAERGVNPALFSQELMANTSDLILDEEVLLFFFHEAKG
ncbi:putative protein phosphatase 2C 1 [Platanthera guangdongensis]|uniref:Protein phosphatase n=1 Tax=Platanthera guangdongensis TaxID=2320717 RepID=A0ABR2M422_9ASPA